MGNGCVGHWCLVCDLCPRVDLAHRSCRNAKELPSLGIACISLVSDHVVFGKIRVSVLLHGDCGFCASTSQNTQCEHPGHPSGIILVLKMHSGVFTITVPKRLTEAFTIVLYMFETIKSPRKVQSKCIP